MVPKHFKSVTSPELPTVYVSNNNVDIRSCDVTVYASPEDIFLDITFEDGGTDSITLLPFTSAEDCDEIIPLDTLVFPAKGIVAFLLWPN